MNPTEQLAERIRSLRPMRWTDPSPSSRFDVDALEPVTVDARDNLLALFRAWAFVRGYDSIMISDDSALDDEESGSGVVKVKS